MTLLEAIVMLLLFVVAVGVLTCCFVGACVFYLIWKSREEADA